ncbi:helix-turn-helix transcriptional regulator [Bifidobacterium longum]|uniref:Helix-turn-helix transcriptional regulator n=1 Tax=Bifidobacterium longum TaxID=216816 RepID=A0A6L4U4D4_BIFLN|nr:helix-turn-helix transcriptional regulator [Bifidobacterium longum]
MTQVDKQNSITAERVEYLRNMRHLKQNEVAKAAAMSDSLYSHKIHGRTQFMPEELRALADFFNTSVDYLMGRTLEPWPVDNTQPEEVTA